MSLHTEAVVDTYQPFKRYWLVWKYLGLQPPKRASKWFKLYIAYSVFLHVSVFLLPISLVINLTIAKNISEICETICHAASTFVCYFKFVNILLVQCKLLEVPHLLERLDARAEADKEVVILKGAIASAKRIFVVFSIIAISFIGASQLMVYFSSERILVLTAWYPWDWKASTKNHLLAHLHQSYSICFHGLMDTACDTFLPTCLIILSAHSRALASRIVDIGSKNINLEDILQKELTDCIKDHNTILELFYIYQEVTTNASLAQFTATCLSQCTLGIYLIHEGQDPLTLLLIFVYFSAITTQIFILCYYGDMYCQANDHLTESIYASNWMDRNIKYKKAILLLLQRSQRPSAIKAGNLIPLQMPTFVKVLKTAYSVFTFLNQSNQ